jgi:hypothetical protein
MSRGPGRWQRAILAELERREQFFLRELLAEYPKRVGYWASRDEWVVEERRLPRRSDAVALQRAAHRLAAQGRIEIDTARYWTNYRQWTGERYQFIGAVIVARPGNSIDRFQLAFAYKQAGEAEGRRRAIEAWQQLKENPLSVATTETTTLNSEPKRVTTASRSTAQLGAIASVIKLLAKEGPVPEDLIIERAQEIIRWPPAQVRLVLEELKASGHYQRLIEDVR